MEQLGGKPTPAVGFALGIERLCLLLETCGAAPEQNAVADVYPGEFGRPRVDCIKLFSEFGIIDECADCLVVWKRDEFCNRRYGEGRVCVKGPLRIG